MYSHALNNSKWAVSKLKEEKETGNYNNRIKQYLNYTETEMTGTNHQWENIKHVITRGAKEILGKLKQRHRKLWVSEKTIAPIGQKRKHKREYN